MGVIGQGGQQHRWMSGWSVAKKFKYFIVKLPSPSSPASEVVIVLDFLYSWRSFFIFPRHCSPVLVTPYFANALESLSYTCLFLFDPSSCSCTPSSPHSSINLKVSASLQFAVGSTDSSHRCANESTHQKS